MSDEIRSILSEDPEARWDAIARHLAGESDPAEAAAVAAWLAAHPEDAALVAVVNARADRTAARAEAVVIDTEAALARVRARMAEPALTVVRGNAAASPTRAARATDAVGSERRWRGWAMAAAAVLVAAVGLRVAFPGDERARGAEVPRAYTTAVGQRDSLRLPDGTIVQLAPGSRLTLAADYGRGAREVTLEGAAFFEVQHDESQPFTVHAAGAAIRDIGTAFTVKTAADGGVSVAVTHGVVSVASSAGAGANVAAAPTELRAGDRATLQAGALEVRRGVVTEEDVAWTHGQLAYRDAPLSEVQADLRRWYGVELRVTDSTLALRTLTATFHGDSVAQVLKTIALALGAETVQRGDTVLLQPTGPGTSTP